MPDNLPSKPTSSAFQPPTASDLGGAPASGDQPATPSKPYTPPATPPEPPTPSPTPPTPPPTEEPGIPMQKPTDKGGSQKAKIVGAVLGLLLLVVALPVAIYLVKQRQYIWPKAEVYPDCEVSKDYSGATTPGYDCKKGKSASVSLKACLPEGCPATDVSYSKTEAYCDGEDWLHCEDACGASAQKGTVHLEGGECKDVPVSCSPHDLCGTCQVDIDGYGVRRWHDEGCGEEPEYEVTCENCYVVYYDEEKKLVVDPETVPLGQKVILATYGSTDHPDDITKARFLVKIVGGSVSPVSSWCQGEGLSVDGDWCVTTNHREGLLGSGDAGVYYYVDYPVSVTGSYTIESMVYNPELDWH